MAASVGLLAAAHTSLKTTASLQTRSEVSEAQFGYRQALCLRQEFERAVPKGVTVYVGDGSSQPSEFLLEAATLWAHPVAHAASAQWTAALTPGKGCFGYVLQAHRAP